MAFPPALKEKVEEEKEVREGEAEEKKGKKKPPFMKKKKAKKDTEIEKGQVGAEGVTKANRSSMSSLDAADFKIKKDGCGCSKKGNVKADGGSCGKKGKKKSVWADGFGKADAEFVLTAGSDKLATEKYAREKRKQNAQGQPHNFIYANTFNT